MSAPDDRPDETAADEALVGRRRWERTRRCACGECRKRPPSAPCPALMRGNDQTMNRPRAIWLWASEES